MVQRGAPAAGRLDRVGPPPLRDDDPGLQHVEAVEEQPLQVLAVAGQHVECHQHAAGRARSDDAGLVLAMEIVVVLGLFTAWRGGHLCRRVGSHCRAAQAAAGNGRASGGHTQQYTTTLGGKLF